MKSFVYQKEFGSSLGYNKVVVSEFDDNGDIKLAVRTRSGESLGVLIIAKKDIPEFCSRLAGQKPYVESNFRDPE